jgi:hypothetical protein
MLASVDFSLLFLLAGAKTGATGAACLVFTAMVGDAVKRVLCGANVEGGAATAATAPAVDVVEAWLRWRCGLA